MFDTVNDTSTLTRVAVKTGTTLGTLHKRLSQTLCGMRGHDSVLHYERNRVLLRCTSCGYDSPGWDTSGVRRPRQTFEGDPQRHMLR